MKKLLFLSLFLFPLFFMSGCEEKNVQIKSDYISLALLIDSESVTMSVEFGFDGERMAGYPQSEVGIFKENLKNGIENLRKEFLLTLALKYTQNPIQEFAINRGVTLSQVSFGEENVGFTIKYNSLSAWKYYNSSSKTEEEKEGFYLVKKLESEGDFPFSSTLTDGRSVGEKYKEVYISSLKNLSFENIELERYAPSFVYDYATFSPSLRSNATTKSNGRLYHHIWIKDILEGEKISLWQYKINYSMWMLLAIVLTILPCVIYVSIQLYKEKKGANYIQIIK